MNTDTIKDTSVFIRILTVVPKTYSIITKIHDIDIKGILCVNETM